MNKSLVSPIVQDAQLNLGTGPTGHSFHLQGRVLRGSPNCEVALHRDAQYQ